MEAKLKTMLGEQAFALAYLQTQLEAMTKERDDLKAKWDALTEDEADE